MKKNNYYVKFNNFFSFLYNLKILLLLLTLINIIFFNVADIRADDMFSYDVGSAIKAITQASSNAEYCKAAGCRTAGTFGVRVSIVGQDGKKISKTSVIDYLVNGSFSSTSGGTVGRNNKSQVFGIDSGGKSSSIKNIDILPQNFQISSLKINPTIKMVNNWNPDFTNVVTYFKNISLELKRLYDQNKSEPISKQIDVINKSNAGKILASHGYTLDKKADCEKLKELNSIYFMVEPISTIGVGNVNGWYQGEPLTDGAIDSIKATGSVTFTQVLDSETLATKIGMPRFLWVRMNKQFDEIERNQGYLDSSQIQFLMDSIRNFRTFIDAYNAMYNQISKVPNVTKKFIGTSSEIAKYVDTLSDKRIAGYKPGGGMVSGSISNHAGNISKYILMGNDSNLGTFYFKPVNTPATRWDSMYKTKDGYGLGVIRLTPEVECSKFCVLTNKDKSVSVPDKYKEKDCCNYQKGSYNLWDMELKDFSSKVEGSTWYKNTCQDNSCKMENGKAVAPKGETAAKYCCTYNNFGNDASQRKTNSGFDNKTAFEAGKWYKDNCVIVTPPCNKSSNITSSTDMCCSKTNYATSVSSLSDTAFKNWLRTNNKAGYDACFPPVSSCQYEVEADCPDCGNTSTGYVKDVVTASGAKDEWQCIYDSKVAPSPWNTNYDSNVSYGFNGNKYCSIYCKEDVVSTYPLDGFSVTNGTKITIGQNQTWGPLNMSGTKECRTNDINYTQFESDYKIANDNVKTTWDNYQDAKKTYESATNKEGGTTYGDKSCGCRYSVGSYSNCSGCCSQTETIYDSLKSSNYYYCPSGGSVSGSSCVTTSYSYVGEDGSCDGTLSNGYCITSSSYDASEGTNYYCSSGYSMSGYGSSATCYKVQCLASACNTASSYYYDRYKYYTYTNYSKSGNADVCENSYSSKLSSLSSTMNSRYSTFVSAKATRDSSLAAINNCSNWSSAINFNSFEPIINVSYDNEEYSLSDEQLASSLKSSTTSTSYNVDGNWQGSEGPKKTISTYVCQTNGVTCSTTTSLYSSNKQSGVTYKKSYDYTLRNNLFRYIDKVTNLSTTIKPGGTNFIDIGYGNLPVSLSSNGKYDISLSLTSFGSNNKFNSFIFGANEPYLTGKCETEYECEYNVNKLVQIDTGLSVIFRSIALNSPFPGMSGSNTRPRGTNWSSSTDVSRYITNNRGVTQDRIYYDKDPLYEIILTPATILEIREYNSQTSYSDFNLNCSNGQRCLSQFIRNSQFSNLFKGCGLNDSSSKCNSGEAWK